ncbi:hypothetical protein BDZ91DRAFT_367586 [Kalaharituber pfeilii]|nr:hypothetical protein BDZ91DRAFT_367586 [Kalaharituber pfeilii]
MIQVCSGTIAFGLVFATASATLTPVYGSAIFRRADCVKCDDNIEQVCPICPSGQICSITTQTCEQCSVARCIDIGVTVGTEKPESDGGSKGGAAGPIAGGVIGGFVVLGLIGFFLWRNMKKKRQEREAAAEKEAAFGASRAARASTHTVTSISSTTTRASNVIQIGYLPGVMNRSAPSTPGQFIPPVPPLPGNGTPEIRYPQSPDQGTFFSADDILRASFITTGDHDPRASVATTIYRNNAIVSPVAANVVRAGKAAVVTVKGTASTASTPQLGSMPPVPNSDFSQYDEKKDGVPVSPAFSVGSTFLNKMNEKNQGADSSGNKVKEVNKRLSVPLRPIPGRTVTAEAVIVESSAWEEDSSDDENEPKHRRRTMDSSLTSEADLEDSPFSDTASFSDIPLPAGTGLPPIMTSTGSKVKRVSVTVKGKGKASSSSSSREDWRSGPDSASSTSTRGRSPFDDANAVGRR